jgi:hypothetical protein
MMAGRNPGHFFAFGASVASAMMAFPSSSAQLVVVKLQQILWKESCGLRIEILSDALISLSISMKGHFVSVRRGL